MSTGKVLLGVLGGVAAGALLGVLMAPAKGKDTRAKISKKGKDGSDSLKTSVNEFLNTISEKFEEVKGEVTEYAEKAKTRAEELK